MKRPAVGHLLAYTALTVILTAGAAQSLSGTNTVDSGDIIDGQIAYSDIRDNAMTGKKILDNSITGADVNASTLTLKAGQTETGDLYFDSHATATGQDFGASTQFHIPLGTFVDEHLTGTNGDATCTGTSSNPTAPAHTLCVYAARSGNMAAATISGHDKDGFRFGGTASAAGDVFVSFRYAVTG